MGDGILCGLAHVVVSPFKDVVCLLLPVAFNFISSGCEGDAWGSGGPAALLLTGKVNSFLTVLCLYFPPSLPAPQPILKHVNFPSSLKLNWETRLPISKRVSHIDRPSLSHLPPRLSLTSFQLTDATCLLNYSLNEVPQYIIPLHSTQQEATP